MRPSLVLFALAGCNFQLIGSGVVPDDATPGDSAIDGAIDTPPVDDVPIDMGAVPVWSQPALLGVDDCMCDDPTLTEDLLELWVDRQGDIYYASRGSTSTTWSALERINELSTDDPETTPEVSANGLIMTFAREVGDFDLRIAQRGSRSELWGGTFAMTELDSNVTDNGGVLSNDRLMVAFSSHRDAANMSNIYVATRAATSTGWSAPVEQTALNTAATDTDLFLAPDKLTIYFASDRSGQLDIYVATRSTPTDAWSAPVLVPDINLPTSADTDPWVSPDGATIVFWSDRSGSGQLYVATKL